MKKLLLLIGFISLTINAQIPNIQWQKSLGGIGNDFCASIIATSDGGCIAAGYTNSTDLTGFHGGTSDALIIKLDSNGNTQWSKIYGGSLNDNVQCIRKTLDNNYIFIGSTNSSDGDLSTTTPNGSSDVWVVKINSTNGNIIWQGRYGGSVGEYGLTIELMNNGYIIGARMINNSINNLGWVLKISDIGAITSTPTSGDIIGDYGNINIGSIIPDTSGSNYRLVGSYNGIGPAGTNGFFGQTFGENDAFIYDSNAQSDTYGDIDQDLFYSGSLTSDNSIVTAGSSVLGSPDNYYSDFWIKKIGADAWTKTYGGSLNDEAKFIQQNSDGTYMVTGYTESPNDGNVTGNHGLSDFWLMKLNSDGNMAWQKTLGGSDYDEAICVQITSDGYLLGGDSRSNDGDVSGNHGNTDFWIVKLNNTLGVNDFSNTSLKLYPNPTRSLINIQSSNNVVLDKISITDLTGKIVMEQTQNTNQVNVEKLASGIYILNAYSEVGKYQEKFIKE